MRHSPRLIALATALGAAACATAPGGDSVAQRDPLERINRPIYDFNRAIDRAAVRPAARAYVWVTPAAGRRGVSNFFENVDEPWTAINALLQGKPRAALRAAARFLINTTLGVGGLADHATFFGIERQEEDFGQTLAVWGLGSGPFLMLPLLGPSTVRDGAGSLVGFVGDPYGFARNRLSLGLAARAGLIGLSGLDARARLLGGAETVLETAADEYATVRSAYIQSRRNAIYDGSPPVEDDDWDMGEEPAEETAPAAPDASADDGLLAGPPVPGPGGEPGASPTASPPAPPPAPAVAAEGLP